MQFNSNTNAPNVFSISMEHQDAPICSQDVRPLSPKFTAHTLPVALTSLDQWVLWTFVRPKNPNKKKWDKLPKQINNWNAKSNDPTTWNSHANCLDKFTENQLSTIRYVCVDGLGVCLSRNDGLTVIDIDHCYDSNGNLKPWGQEIVDKFSGTYIERSPSGDGLHIWCYGKPLKTGEKKWKEQGTDQDVGIEVYSYPSNRFMTVTGDVINQADITDQQDALNWLCKKYWTEDEINPQLNKPHFNKLNFGDLRDDALTALHSIPADCGYPTWIKIGMALKHGGYPLEMWDQWSQQSATKYQPGECERKWRTF